MKIELDLTIQRRKDQLRTSSLFGGFAKTCRAVTIILITYSLFSGTGKQMRNLVGHIHRYTSFCKFDEPMSPMVSESW